MPLYAILLSLDVGLYDYRILKCSFKISRIPGNSREIGVGIPAFPGNGPPGNRETLVRKN